MLNVKVLRVKNYVILSVVVLYYIVSAVISRPFLYGINLSHTAPDASREARVYFQQNLVFVLFFIVFASLALTSFIMAYLIYQKFDRNRAAARTSVREGMFLWCIALYVITDSNALDVFNTHVSSFDYLGCVSLMLAVLTYFTYAGSIYNKPWLKVFDLVVSAEILLVYAFDIFGLGKPAVQLMLSLVHLSFIVLLCIGAFFRMRANISKRLPTRPLYVLLGCVEILSFAMAEVFFILQSGTAYWICFGVGLVILAYLAFSEVVNMAARQYINSAEAENYRKMAYVDALCSIGNRNAFLLEQKETFDSDALFYVVFDVNNLKSINDALGHSEGDSVIIRSASIISQSFDGLGNCYRIGGDEFAVIGRYCSEDDLKAALRRMKRSIDKYNKTAPAKIDLAYGYAIRETTDINTYELFNKADKLMYRYKRGSKTRSA